MQILLTDDVLKEILQFLDLKTLCKTSPTSKQFNRVKNSLLAEMNSKITSRYQNNTLRFFLKDNPSDNLILFMAENKKILGSMDVKTLEEFLLNLPEAYLQKALKCQEIVNLMNYSLLKKIIDKNPSLIEFILSQQNRVTALADVDLLFHMITRKPSCIPLLWQNPDSKFLQAIDTLIMLCLDDEKIECLSYFATSDNSLIKNKYHYYTSFMNPSM